MNTTRWSSGVAFYLATIGAAVGLGSIWRFPYLVGTQGGSAFILVFIVACMAIAIPLLAAEFLIGRRARVNPPQAAGVVAESVGGSSAWNAIGVLGTSASYLIISYYTLIAGWVLAFTWKCASGQLHGLDAASVRTLWQGFLANPIEMGAWHFAFLAGLVLISGRGVVRGLEVVNRWRAPVLLALLLLLVIYSLSTGDAARGLAYTLLPDFSRINAEVMLNAIGQAFYATGVGLGMMIAYGAYAPADSSLLRSATLIVVAILVVSALASLLVFPLVFQYGLDPAQGPDLVFVVLPTAFALMPGGQVVGTLFFALLVVAALTPSMAGFEPAIAWLEQRAGFTRLAAAVTAIGVGWLVGIGSVLSFNIAADWHPLAAIPRFATSTFFDVLDYVTSNLMLPLGALLTCIFVGWRLPRAIHDEAYAQIAPWQRSAIVWMLRIVCPVAIVIVVIATLA